ncbi:MAG: hypothetical protein WCI43_02395 [Candidatus Firestonebacteria bacterium]
MIGREKKNEIKPVNPERKAPGGNSAAQKLLDASQISLVLDTYDDIFSGFDPRSFDHRSLSQDFLFEAKRAARDKVSGLELKFLIPKTERNEQQEELIGLRLREHFEKHAALLREEMRKTRMKGALLTAVGMCVTAAAATLAFHFKESFLAGIAVVVLEPAGWFTIWNGLEMSFFALRNKQEDLEFYGKMEQAEVTFTEY